MTDDIDAVKERWLTAQHQGRLRGDLAWASAADVPALLGHLAEVEAERDHWQQIGRQERERRCKAEDERDDAVRAHGAAVGTGQIYERAHKELAAENACLRQERDAMRPVVEAAEALAAGVGAALPGYFRAAVDAYRAAQKAPLDRPETTVGQDQAEVALASTNTAQAQRGVRGGEYLSSKHHIHEVRCVDRTCSCWNEPSDPPGLDAVIEASVAAYDLALNETLRNPPGSVMGAHGRIELAKSAPWRAAIDAAVRAAAPALRAGALREAADEAVEWHNFQACALDVEVWLRERADRIGGAT